MQLVTPDLTYKFLTMSPGKHLLWNKKTNIKVTSHENGVGVGRCTIVSAGFF